MKRSRILKAMLSLSLCIVICSCSMKKVEKQTSDAVTERIGTIVNQKWSTYKYRSHFKKTHAPDNSVDMYSRLVKNEAGDNYIYTIDLFIRNDSIIYEGYNLPFVYDEFLKLDSLLLDCSPTNVVGDFTPEDKYMNRTYFFDKFYVRVNKAGIYSIMFFSNNF